MVRHCVSMLESKAVFFQVLLVSSESHKRCLKQRSRTESNLSAFIHADEMND